MISRPADLNGFEFAVLASLRAHQLMDGCVPLMGGDHKSTTMAQMEVAAGKILRLIAPVAVLLDDAAPGPAIIDTAPDLALDFVPME